MQPGRCVQHDILATFGLHVLLFAQPLFVAEHLAGIHRYRCQGLRYDASGFRVIPNLLRNSIMECYQDVQKPEFQSQAKTIH